MSNLGLKIVVYYWRLLNHRQHIHRDRFECTWRGRKTNAKLCFRSSKTRGTAALTGWLHNSIWNFETTNGETNPTEWHGEPELVKTTMGGGPTKDLKATKTMPSTGTKHRDWHTVLLTLCTDRCRCRLRPTSLLSWGGGVRAESKVGLIGADDFGVLPVASFAGVVKTAPAQWHCPPFYEWQYREGGVWSPSPQCLSWLRLASSGE